MAYNKLKFNDDNTEYLVVCAPWSRDKIHVQTLTVGTSLVKATVSARNFGVRIDHAFKMPFTPEFGVCFPVSAV